MIPPSQIWWAKHLYGFNSYILCKGKVVLKLVGAADQCRSVALACMDRSDCCEETRAFNLAICPHTYIAALMVKRVNHWFHHCE